MATLLGLDLGQAADPTALVGLEQSRGPDRRGRYAVKYLRRFHLGTPYPDVVAEVGDLLSRLEARRPAGRPAEARLLVVDQTGVGRPVVDLFRAAGGACLQPVTITAGHQAGRAEDGSWHVPKKHLVGTVQVLLQQRRLAIPRGLPDAALLTRELENFRVKVTLAGHETFEAWREGQHDDLVLAAALACWAGERLCVEWHQTSGDPAGRSLMDRAPPGLFYSPEGGGNPWDARC